MREQRANTTAVISVLVFIVQDILDEWGLQRMRKLVLCSSVCGCYMLSYIGDIEASNHRHIGNKSHMMTLLA